MKKTFLAVISAILIAGMVMGCSNGNSDDNSGTNGNGGNTGTYASKKLCLFNADSTVTWNIWAWKPTSNTNYSTKGWPGGDIQLTGKDETNGYVYTTMSVDTSDKLGLLFVASTGSPQTGDIIVSVEDLKAYDTFYFVDGESNYYTSMDAALGVKSAEVTSDDGNTIEVKIIGVSSVASDDFAVKNSDGTALTVSKAVLSGTKATITVTGGDVNKLPYSLTYKTTTVYVTPTAALLDKFFAYTGSDLGWNGTDTVKIWAPIASKVVLNVYKNASDTTPEKTFSMTLGAKGVWSQDSLAAYISYYYDFTVTNEGSEKTVLDPYAKSMAAFDSSTAAGGCGRGVLVDSSKMGSVTNGYVTLAQREDAVIYEISVRDFTISPDSGVDTSKRGTYEGFKEKLDYLKSLGVTHIELLPVLNCYNGNESNRSYEGTNGSAGTTNGNNYNWGYDPHNYFTPEGWYASDASDPYARVTELKNLINAAHADGLGIILDVVYNHVAKASLLDDIVPGYYFRTSSGSLTNNSGCGNDTATERTMMAKILGDSIEYWTKEYKVDGFRFDISGLIAADAIENAYDRAAVLNPSTIFIGEGWSYSVSDVTLMNQAYMTSTDKCAVFNDNIRDQSKTGSYTDDGTAFITGGTTVKSLRYFYNLIGQPNKTRGDSYTSDDPGDNVQYVVCHDGLTLHDVISYKMGITDATDEAQLVKRIKMGNFITLTSQGISFLHGGQERGRTKPSYGATKEVKGAYVSNSYDSSDSINQIVWTMDSAYQGLHDYTAGLIALRKSATGFRLGTHSAITNNTYQISTGTSETTQVMAYMIYDGSTTWIILMNGSNTVASISTGTTLDTASVYVDANTAGTTAIPSPVGITLTGKTAKVDPLTCIVLKK